MLRSMVARSQPLLSRLRWPDATPVNAKPWILPSRAYAISPTPAARSNGSADMTMAPAAARHLYLVLEETNRHSIYKLRDIDGHDEAPRRLPRAALRLSHSLINSSSQFEALGDKIVIYGYTSAISQRPNIGELLTLLYDTKKGTLEAGRPLPHILDLPDDEDEVWIKDEYHAAVPVGGGDKLCVLEAVANKPFYLYKKDDHYYLPKWTWKQGPSPLPLDATGYDISVNSHAVHPDGRTIFASSTFTFSLNTEDGKSARHGDWLLPFNGRAYYDGDLDAWVGIRLADGTEGESIKGYPYLCACDVPKTLDDDTMLAEPTWTMCKEELTFVEKPSRARPRSPTLVPIGRGKFCLVEASEGAVARVTVFCAKRAKNGELEVTPCRPSRSYLVPNYSGGLLTALWM